MRNLKSLARLSLAIVFGAAMLSACNTMEGVGRDIKSAGESLEEAAK